MKPRALPASARAFTLMEVLISMVLMVVLISIVAGSVDFHLRQLTVRQTRIEEAQVARVVLRRIADDLRAVAVSRPNSSKTSGATGGATSGESGGEAGDAGGTDDSGTGSGATMSSASDDTSASSSGSSMDDTSDMSGMGTDASSAQAAGFYGTLYELQVDVSRIPRYEEYSMVAASSSSGGVGLASDVRTVSYYAMDGTSAGAGNSGAAVMADDWSQSGALLDASTEYPKGLVRRVVERAAERYAREMSDYSQVQEHVDAFAPEVLWIEFRYFDGMQWLTEWDSDAMGGVPMAVEITMELDDGSGQSDRQSTSSPSSSDFNEHVYRLVVHLPAAEPLTQETDSTTSTDGSSGSTSGSTTGGGTQ